MHEGIFDYRCPADPNEVVCKSEGRGKGVPVHYHEGASGTGTATLFV
jgi:hypothetical protein